MKKKIMLIIIILIILSLGGGYIYRLHHPHIEVGVGGGHGLEIIHIAFSEPISDEIEKNIMEIGEWNDAIVSELMNETVEPRDIKVSGEVVDGKTTLRYEGIYTSKDGQSLEYFEEKTFDFVLVSEDELLK